MAFTPSVIIVSGVVERDLCTRMQVMKPLPVAVVMG